MNVACHVRRLSLADIGSLELAAWQGLAIAAGEEANVFLEPWFLHTALAQFDPCGEVRLLVVEDDRGCWHGLMPVAGVAWLGRIPLWSLRGWGHANQFLGTPLLRAGSEENAWRHLLDALDRAGDGRIALTISNAPADDPVVAALHRACVATRRQCRVVGRGNRPVLELADPSRGLIPSKRRARLRAQMARLDAAHGHSFETLSAAADIDTWTDQFLALERLGWKGAAGSALACDARTTQMFRTAMREGFASGRLRAHALRVDGRAIAMTTYFVRGGRAYGFKACYDEAFAAYAPGLLLLREVMRVLSVPIVFDSCADAQQAALNDMWRGRREILDICVSLGRRRRLAYRALLAVRDVWHALKSARPADPIAASRSPA